MQAECFHAYIQCVQANRAGELAQDLSCTLMLISCINAHVYGSTGEHRVGRPGEADETGEAVLESEAVVRVLEAHSAEVQAYAERARQLKAVPAAPEQAALHDGLAHDLDDFVQTMIQEFNRRKG
jgi:hypothetical protein